MHVKLIQVICECSKQFKTQTNFKLYIITLIGGPLAVQVNGQSLLVGVTIFVAGNLCDSGLPTGFSRVSSFIPWIELNM